ncbi:MAG: cation:proton antiporter [Candidatus Helarchaeota archaeon]
MEELSYIPLLIVIFFAFITPIITTRIKTFRIPVFVGELIIGIILFNTLFEIYPIENTLDWDILLFLRDFGFAFLMFLSGMEIDFHHLIHPDIKKEIDIRLREIEKKHEQCKKEKDESCKHLEEMKEYKHWHFPQINISKKPYIIGILIYLATLGLSFLVFYLVSYFHPMNFVFVAIMFSTTSVGMVFPILHELNLSKEDLGHKIEISSIVADFVSMILITIIIALFTMGFAQELLLIPLIFVIFFAFYQVIRIFKKHPKWYSAIFLKELRTYEVRTTASIFLLILFIILALNFGIEMILGAFLAGVLLSLIVPHGKIKALYEKLHAIGYGFLIPIFFITIGLDLSFGQALLSWDAIGFALIIVFLSFLIKIIPNMLFLRLSGNTWKEGISAGIIQSARLSLVIAAAEIGIYYNFFGNIMLETAVLTIIITSVVSPVLFAKLLKRKKKEPPKKFKFVDEFLDYHYEFRYE